MVPMKLNKLTEKATVATAAYLGLYTLYTGIFDLMSFLLYIAVGIVVANVAAGMLKKKWGNLNTFLVGAAIPAVYNLIGIFAGWFTYNVNMIILAAIQQGVVSFIIWKIMGGKK